MPTARGAGQGLHALPPLAGRAAQQGEVSRVTARTLDENDPCEAMLARACFTDVRNDGAVLHGSWTPAPCAKRR